MVTMTDEHDVPVLGSDAMARLQASAALDDLLGQIDSGSVQLNGRDGLVQELIKAVLERGLRAELADHVGYRRGDPESAAYPNSRNGSSAKTVTTTVGDVDLDVPRDRLGMFNPTLVPRGARRLGRSRLNFCPFTGVHANLLSYSSPLAGTGSPPGRAFVSSDPPCSYPSSGCPPWGAGNYDDFDVAHRPRTRTAHPDHSLSATNRNA